MRKNDRLTEFSTCSMYVITIRSLTENDGAKRCSSLLSLSASSRRRDHKQGDRLLVVFVNPYSGIPSISIGFASAVSTSNLSKKEV